MRQDNEIDEPDEQNMEEAGYDNYPENFDNEFGGYE
jgi:hypothetical protein